MQKGPDHLANADSSAAIQPAFVVGGKYNWRGQNERLAYMGVARYPGDRRAWHQFEKVDEPGAVWCEVLDGDLASFEATAA